MGSWNFRMKHTFFGPVPKKSSDSFPSQPDSYPGSFLDPGSGTCPTDQQTHWTPLSRGETPGHTGTDTPRPTQDSRGHRGRKM